MPEWALATIGDQLVAWLEPVAPALAERGRQVAARQRAEELHVAVVGDFNRGKSTVVNALVGEEVLPTGVVPVTAVSAEVRFGPRGALVVGLDGGRKPIDLTDVRGYVAESSNPGNAKGVAHVEVTVPAPLLGSGLVLVDTPGTGSVYLHNTAVARAAQGAADGAVVVLAADSALSATDRELLQALVGRVEQVFVLVNKADRLDETERDQVRWFVASQSGFPADRIWFTDATDAAAGGGIEFADFVAALRRLADEDLAQARDRATRAGLSQLAAELADLMRIEQRALALSIDEHRQLVVALRHVADEVQHAFAAECRLLDARCAELAAGAGDRLAEAARGDQAAAIEELSVVARTARPGQLERALEAGVAEAVRTTFDAAVPPVQDWVDQGWQRAAARLRSVVAARVDDARAAASDLFGAPLAAVPVPPVEGLASEFSYLFLPPMSTSEPFIAAGRHLVPTAIRRRRLATHAIEDLRRELDKHAGRARHDLACRLDQVRRQFEAEMSEHVETAALNLLAAAERAAQWVSDDDRTAEQRRIAEVTDRVGALREQLAGSNAR